jgi:UDP-N-acetylglucosamine diphosphorylase/glucosamine-1-phosphate N-acetyltransferase
VPGRETFIYCISQSEIVDSNKILVHKAVSFNGEIRELQYPWQIFQMNAEAIRDDFQLLTAGRKSAKISKTNTVIGKAVFLEEGVQMEACVLNAVDGPIYVGKNATIMEGSLLRGPLAIGDGSVVKMGTRVYGATTIGPGCTVGGEIKNAVLFANSNKAHDGYLGDSVIGEWCNLGAGTSNSNLKNNVSDVVIWTPHGPRSAGMKCGVLMGDYSRTAINTAINTGTVIGVCCNVMGNGLTPKYIPSFSWGSDGLERYRFEKAIHDIANWKRLKKQEITENDRMILQHIFDHY